MEDPTTSIYLRNARRQILHALSTGKEHNLYGAIYQLIGHRCHLETIKDHKRVAFYCDPQGVLAFNPEFSRSEREGFNDPDYAPLASPVSRARMCGDEAAVEVGNDASEGGEGAPVAEEGEEGEEEEEEEEEEEDPTGFRDEVPLRPAAESELYEGHPAASSAGATASSASTMVSLNIARYPDYRLVKAYLDERDNERVRYDLAIVEVKIYNPPDDGKFWKERQGEVNLLAGKMLPQVIQAVQVIFAKHPSYQEVVAIPVVNEYCRFMYFRRSDVPPFDHTNFDRRGYREPGNLEGVGLARKLEKYAYRVSGNMIKMVYGVHDDSGKVWFGSPFVTHWNNFLAWTNKRDKFGHALFPERVENL